MQLEQRLLSGKGADEDEHDPGHHRHIADPKCEGPLDKVGLGSFELLATFGFGALELVVQPVDFFSKVVAGLLHAVEAEEVADFRRG